MFISEQAFYRGEGLNWMEISFQDNQHVIDLISRRPNGLLVLLETHGMLNRRPNDAALLASFNQAHHISNGGSNSFFNTPPNSALSTAGYSPMKSAKSTRPSSFYLANTSGNNGSTTNGMLTPPPAEVAVEAAGSAAYVKSKFSRSCFSIKHFAGDVMYNVDGFLMKNNDALQDDLVYLLNFSSNAFLVEVAGNPTLPSSACSSKEPMGTGRTSAKMAAASTVSSQFREQLDALMGTLKETHPHYIKCIKPNGQKQARCFDNDLVMQQLRYSGVLEVVRIRREGFPVRVTFLDFFHSYKVLLGLGPTFRLSSQEEARPFAAKIAKKALSAASYQVGHSQVFLKDRCTQQLKAAVQQYFHDRAVVLQGFFRRLGYMKRRLQRRMAILIQKNVRMYMLWISLQRLRGSVRVVGRAWKARKVIFELRRRIAMKRRIMKASPPRYGRLSAASSPKKINTYSDMIRSSADGMKRIASGVFNKERVFKRSICIPAGPNSSSKSVMEGWIRKKKTGVKWQRRWMVLTEDHLTYFGSPAVTDKAPRFSMPLKDCSVRRVEGREPVIEVRSSLMPEKPASKKRFFGSSSSFNKKESRESQQPAVLALLADNEADLQQWLLPLQAVAAVGSLKSGIRDCQSPVSIHTSNLAKYAEVRSPLVKDKETSRPNPHFAIHSANMSTKYSENQSPNVKEMANPNPKSKLHNPNPNPHPLATSLGKQLEAVAHSDQRALPLTI